MRQDRDRFRAIDDAALTQALLSLRTCPHCRVDLYPVALLPSVFGCVECHETWYLPAEDDTRTQP